MNLGCYGECIRSYADPIPHCPTCPHRVDKREPKKQIFEVELTLKNNCKVNQKFSCYDESMIPMLAEKRGLKVKSYLIFAQYYAEEEKRD